MNTFVFKYNPEKYPIYYTGDTSKYFSNKIENFKNFDCPEKIIFGFFALLTVKNSTRQQEQYHKYNTRTYHDVLRLIWTYGYRIEPTVFMKALYDLVRAELIYCGYCYLPALGYIFKIFNSKEISRKLKEYLFNESWDQFNSLFNSAITTQANDDVFTSMIRMPSRLAFTNHVIWSYYKGQPYLSFSEWLKTPDEYRLVYINPPKKYEKNNIEHPSLRCYTHHLGNRLDEYITEESDVVKVTPKNREQLFHQTFK